MIGCNVSYREGAFRTPGSWEGNYSSPTCQQRKDVLEWARGSVLDKGDGQWMIVEKRLGYHMDAELMVIVPAGDGQREQLYAAIAHFEEVMAARLGAPVDTTLRSIEDDGPKCDTCGKKPDWVRKIRVPRFLDDAHFCSIHAREQKDFHYSGPSDSYLHQLAPTST